MLSEEDYDRLVGLFYDAALEPDRWREVVDQLTRSFDAVGASLYTPFAMKLGLEPVWSTDADPEFIATYAAKYARHDVLAEALWRRLPAPTIVFSWDEMLDRHALEAWDGYRELLAPRGVHDGVGLLVGADGHRAGQLMVYTGSWPAPRIESVKAGMARLGKHFARAMRLHWHLSAARRAIDTAQVTLDMFTSGVVWLSRDGLVLYRNAEADRLLAADDGISLIGGKLRFAERSADAALAVAIKDAAAARQSALMAKRPSGAEPYRLTIAPLPLSATALRLPHAAAIAFISESPVLAETSVVAVAKVYQLTPAEARVLQLLVAGRDAQAIAGEIGSRLATVRTQLKSLMVKCGVSRQAELVRLASSFPQARETTSSS